MAARGLLVGVGVASVLAAGATAAGGSDRACSGTPGLRLVDSRPVKLEGSGFCARERLRVRAHAGDSTRSRRVRADAAGRFRVRFRALHHDRCADSLTAFAMHSGDVRASLKRPRKQCPVPLPPS